MKLTFSKIQNSLFILGVATTIISCSQSGQKTKNEKVEENPIIQIEQSHQKEAFLSKEAVQFEMKLSFGGKERLVGKFTLETNSNRGLIELQDSSRIYYIKDKVYYSPGLDSSRVRFDAYTWSYFFLFPYKLRDPGTQWSETQKEKLNESTFHSAKLTFKNGVGDTSDDWYKVYSDLNTDLIHVSSYIVTAGKSLEEAEKDPHAIKYDQYEAVEGVPFAKTWSFWGWTQEKGLTDQLGQAELKNISFVSVDESTFTVPGTFLEK